MMTYRNVVITRRTRSSYYNCPIRKYFQEAKEVEPLHIGNRTRSGKTPSYDFKDFRNDIKPKIDQRHTVKCFTCHSIITVMYVFNRYYDVIQHEQYKPFWHTLKSKITEFQYSLNYKTYKKCKCGLMESYVDANEETTGYEFFKERFNTYSDIVKNDTHLYCKDICCDPKKNRQEPLLSIQQRSQPQPQQPQQQSSPDDEYKYDDEDDEYYDEDDEYYEDWDTDDYGYDYHYWNDNSDYLID